jgi:hypothetical protein
MLTTLFHPKIDFQMSALSTYKPSVTCHSFPVTSSFYLRNDQIMRKHEISKDKIIRFEDVWRPMKDHSFGDFEMVSKFLKNFSYLSKYKRIVVLLCAGRAEMELLSEDLCICMDVDKRALSSSLFALRYMYQKKANIIYHRRDMSVGIYSLLETIRKIPELPLVFLVQHPCPTKSKNKLSRSASDCFFALPDYIIDSVHFVYDSHVNLNKNCWNYQSLKNLLTED